MWECFGKVKSAIQTLVILIWLSYSSETPFIIRPSWRSSCFLKSHESFVFVLSLTGSIGSSASLAVPYCAGHTLPKAIPGPPPQWATCSAHAHGRLVQIGAVPMARKYTRYLLCFSHYKSNFAGAQKEGFHLQQARRTRDLGIFAKAMFRTGLGKGPFSIGLGQKSS